MSSVPLLSDSIHNDYSVEMKNMSMESSGNNNKSTSTSMPPAHLRESLTRRLEGHDKDKKLTLQEKELERLKHEKVEALNFLQAHGRRKIPPRPMSLRQVGREIIERKFDKSVLRRDLAIAILSISGMLASFVSIMIGWYAIRTPNNDQIQFWKDNYGCSPIFPRPQGMAFSDWTNAMNCANSDTPPPITATVTDYSESRATYVRLCDYIVFGTTMLTILGLLDYYRLVAVAQKKDWANICMYSKSVQLDPRSRPYSIWRTQHILWFFVEVILHLLIPYPFLDTGQVVKINEQFQDSWMTVTFSILQVALTIRVYVLVRLFHHLSPVYTGRHDLVRSSSEMRRNYYEITIVDTFKFYYQNYTVSFLVVSYAICTFTGGLSVFLLERYDPRQVGQMDQILNCIFTMFYSIRTIGYGDQKPFTVQGRVAMSFFSFIGMMCESFLIGVVINRFTLTREERFVDEFVKTNYSWCELQVASALLIQATWKQSMRYKFLRGIISKKTHDGFCRRLEARTKRNKKFGTMGSTMNMVMDNNSFFPTATTMDDQESVASSGAQLHYDRLAARESERLLANLKPLNRKERKQMNESLTAKDDKEIPPLREERRNLPPMQVIREYKQLFTTDVDIVRFRALSVDPPDFNWGKNLHATQTVQYESGGDGVPKLRRVPYVVGHKANILFEALKFYRNIRRKFKMALMSSPDHVLEDKLGMIFNLLEQIEKELRRTDAGIMNLRQTADFEIDAVKTFLKKEMKRRV